MSKFLGVVLAGGRSSRMGQDKSLLTYKGKTFLDHLVQILKQTGACDEVAVSGKNSTIYPIIADKFPNSGPLSGVYSALESTNLNALFVPVDMPLLDAVHLRKLTQTNKTLCYFEHSPFPLFVKNTQEVKIYLAQALNGEQTNRSIKGFIERFDTNKLTVENSSFLANINTTHDYQKWIK